MFSIHRAQIQRKDSKRNHISYKKIRLVLLYFEVKNVNGLIQRNFTNVANDFQRNIDI